MHEPELSPEEKKLISDLESTIRNAVWSNSAKVFEGTMESEGKWIEYPLRLPKKKFMDKYLRVALKPDSPSEDFRDAYCAFGTNHLHTAVAVYRVLRRLKLRGLLNIEGFVEDKM